MTKKLQWFFSLQSHKYKGIPQFHLTSTFHTSASDLRVPRGAPLLCHSKSYQFILIILTHLLSHMYTYFYYTYRFLCFYSLLISSALRFVFPVTYLLRHGVNIFAISAYVLCVQQQHACGLSYRHFRQRPCNICNMHMLTDYTCTLGWLLFFETSFTHQILTLL